MLLQGAQVWVSAPAWRLPTPVAQDLMPDSDLHRSQACTWCTQRQAGKALIYKIKQRYLIKEKKPCFGVGARGKLEGRGKEENEINIAQI